MVRLVDGDLGGLDQRMGGSLRRVAFCETLAIYVDQPFPLVELDGRVAFCETLAIYVDQPFPLVELAETAADLRWLSQPFSIRLRFAPTSPLAYAEH